MRCKNCGGEWNPPKNISLTICPFCNTPIIEKNEQTQSLQPYEIIKNIVDKYGEEIFSNSKKLSALMMDFFTEKTKEKNILGIAVHAGIANKILSANNLDKSHKEIIYQQCKEFLSEDYGMNEKWSEFAVYCFTYALGWDKDITCNFKSVDTKAINYDQSLDTNKNSNIILKEVAFTNDDPKFSNSIEAAINKEKSKLDDTNSKDSIAAKVFKRYRNLKSPIVPNTIIPVDLNDKEVITRTTIPNNTKSIEYRAFANSKNLVNITIPNTVTSIGSEAFINCKNLKSIAIPSSVASIGDGAFKGCINLTDINVDKRNIKYSSNNGMLLSYDKTKLLSYPSAIIANIPNGVTYIGNNAFGGCENLTSIIIPKSVNSIEYNAFWGCINLKNIIIDKKNIPYSSSNGVLFDYYKTKLISYPSAVNVNIPDTVTHIGYGAFGGCKNLETLTIPSGVTSIGNYAFEGCINLKNIYISERVAFIADSAFDGCVNLKNIVIDKRNTRYSSENGILFNKEKTSLFSYPSAIVADIPKSVNHICDSAFLGCENLRRVVIPNSVTSIGYMAFAGCKNLTTISIPNSVTSIGNYAFVNCDKLIVYCKANSYAERYCKDNNINYNN